VSSKFFTNQNGNTLEKRLQDILSHYNVEFLEFLIGYFRISGFVKIAPYLSNRVLTELKTTPNEQSQLGYANAELSSADSSRTSCLDLLFCRKSNIKKARILVGINVDTIIAKAKAKGKKANLFDGEGFKHSFKEEQKKVLAQADYAKEVDESVEILIKMLEQNSLELKISKDKNIHSKIYILREEPKPNHNGSLDYRGSVITGSSNLSHNGLTKNYEFNIELRDSDEIQFSLEEFEKLWTNAVEITQSEIENIKEESYLKEITPFELYIKFLIEHFNERIDFDESVADDLPKGFKKLAYQIDAVNEGLAKLKKHGGFFLSDVVGLGKTVTTAMIVRKLAYQTKGQILIIAPPSIRKEWEETFQKFQIGSIRHFKFYSYGELEKIKNTTEFETVIIDESHKFKNFATSRYRELERICKEQSKYKKKIILVSATPLNNKPQDLANQLYLFQNKRKSTIDSFPNLESFFAKIDKEYSEIIAYDKNNPKPLTKEQLQQLKALSQRVRDNILREVMVRRTRTDLEKIDRYKDDIKAQGLNIPKINEVQELEYFLDDDLAKIFSESVEILTDTEKKLKYARYKALAKLTKNAQMQFGYIQEGFLEISSESLAKIMQTMLIKRLESSFYAFKTTINKQKKNLERFIKMFEDGEIYIPSEKINFFEILESEDDEDEIIEKLLQKDKIKRFEPQDFNKGYIEELKGDLILLERLIVLWQNIDNDPKLERFKEILKANTNEKIVVFTESKQTALYLEKSINDKKLLVVHGENRDKLKDTIRENFDANYETQKNDFNTIISTDTLSEGVNMHRSNIIYNYDIPWNATRLMQRIGRINRIGTKHSEIFVYNFKPTAQSEKLIELSKKAFIKLQTFHHSLGEDSKIYTKDEEVGSVSLFEENVESQIDEELPFLEEIRAYKEAYPKTFREIQKLPQKLRVQREKKEKVQSFVFIKNSDSKNYYKVKDHEVVAVNFVEMAKNLKATQDEKPKLPLQEIHYQHIELTHSYFEKELINTITQSQTENIKIEHKIDKQAITILKSWYQKELISDKYYEQFLEIVRVGQILNIAKELTNISKSAKPFEVMAELDKLHKRYTLTSKDENDERINLKIDIILSETFI